MGFQRDLMMIQKWLTFYWATLYIVVIHLLTSHYSDSLRVVADSL